MNNTTVISEKDMDNLLDVIDNPPEPNDALKEAMNKYVSNPNRLIVEGFDTSTLH